MLPFSARTSRTLSTFRSAVRSTVRDASLDENSTRWSAPIEAIASPGVPRAITFPVIHDRELVAQALGLIHVVRRQQDRPAGLLEFLDQVPQLPPCLRIETGRRFVEKEQIGIADERAGEREALLLAAGQIADPGRALLLELHERARTTGRR